MLAIAREPSGQTSITIRQVEKKGGKADALRGFAHPTALPSKRVMSWVFAGVILIILLAIPVVTHLTRTPLANDPESDSPGQVKFDAAWSTGELSLAHDLGDNCEACHVAPFVSVRDETCLTCHEELGEHAAAPRLSAGMPPLGTGDAIQWQIAQSLGKEGPGSCTSCHTEHEGPVRQQPASEQFCADCHDALDTRLTDTRLGNANDFGKLHPEFRPAFFTALGADKPRRISLAKQPVERSGLKFPHDVHMNRQGGAARMAISLAKYGEPLECSDCHTPDKDRVGFKPIEMEPACESCHSLVADKAGGAFRSLRHGDVEDLREDLMAIDRGPHRPLVSGRQRPGQFARGGTYYSNFGRPASSFISINRALAPGGICLECHLPTRTGGKPDLIPVNLPDRFLRHGFFNHDAHKDENCTDCHTADTSKEASDLLIPDLESCRDCHLGATAIKTRKIVPSSCAMCHSYHVPTGPWSQDHPELPDAPKNNVAAILGGLRR